MSRGQGIRHVVRFTFEKFEPGGCEEDGAGQRTLSLPPRGGHLEIKWIMEVRGNEVLSHAVAAIWEGRYRDMRDVTGVASMRHTDQLAIGGSEGDRKVWG